MKLNHLDSCSCRLTASVFRELRIVFLYPQMITHVQWYGMFGGFKMGAGFDDDVTSTFVTHKTYEDGTNIDGGSTLKK